MIGTAQIAVQLETKPFKMSIKPPSYQVIVDGLNKVLYCGANGSPDLMSGKWINAFNGEQMNTIIEREGYLFKIKTSITKEGSCRCQITFLKSVVESTTLVNKLKHKLTCSAFIFLSR